ncbi:hypothetical protein [Chryseolinea lacunae]|uniref:Uncharacterized protein n=1 Tax=Chryseolinea lacunae TaxID=2801331 RepID=A0ABS1L172_9BACT|nr:hypothetical protein [Chryseolinea lacunae]MBL0745436.1 hypothetical protein [Chryseolinea lacunae]
MKTNLLVPHEILTSKKIRATPIRILCLQSILKFKEPFTIDHLMSSLRWRTKINVVVARRTLGLYEKCGLLSTTKILEHSVSTDTRKKIEIVNYQWTGSAKTSTNNTTIL